MDHMVFLLPYLSEKRRQERCRKNRDIATFSEKILHPFAYSNSIPRENQYLYNPPGLRTLFYQILFVGK